MPTLVKICGIKTDDEVGIINDYPIQFAGFIFAPSRRQVSKETAITLRKKLRKDIKVVGVFVNETKEMIDELIACVPLDVIQLHGNETPAFCASFSVPVWKSLSIDETGTIENISGYRDCDAILLDTRHQGQSGGTGMTFDWKVARHLSEEYRIVLAGGLKADNVIEGIEALHPWAVDLNSGLETEGYKDREKVAAVFQRLKEEMDNE